MLLLIPAEVLELGFCFFSGLPNINVNDWKEQNVAIFKQHYGSSPTIIAIMWVDMQQNNTVSAEDQSYKGFKYLLTAIHFL